MKKLLLITATRLVISVESFIVGAILSLVVLRIGHLVAEQIR